jgi:hypothetical protein
MVSPRSFRGDHWTLNKGMVQGFKRKVGGNVDLCGNCSRHSPSPRLITDSSSSPIGAYRRRNPEKFLLMLRLAPGLPHKKVRYTHNNYVTK